MSIKMYFTNFFISRTEFWNHDNIQKFLTDIDKTGNIYIHRWGDAPIQTETLNIFINTDKIIHGIFTYVHFK